MAKTLGAVCESEGSSRITHDTRAMRTTVIHVGVDIAVADVLLVNPLMQPRGTMGANVSSHLTNRGNMAECTRSMDMTMMSMR